MMVPPGDRPLAGDLQPLAGIIIEPFGIDRRDNCARTPARLARCISLDVAHSARPLAKV